MESTANLHLPYIMPAQAQKHVTHNEALAMLDAIVQLSARDRDLTAPPGSESEGDRYIVAIGATGLWTGWDGAIALWMGGGWRRIDPNAGWLAWVEDEDALVRWTGSEWSEVTGGAPSSLQDIPLLGVGTSAGTEHPFAASLNNALWTARYDAEGGDGDLRVTLNKEDTADTLSLLMQSDWSGRAEIGLVGNDDLSIKVSPDGESWKEAVRVDRTSGATSFPHTAALTALSPLTGESGAFARFTGADTASMQTIVGAVSQASGVPTGAIVERGSNANGDYVRFADGTQICTRHVDISLTTTSLQQFDWAANFVSPQNGNHICRQATPKGNASARGQYALTAGAVHGDSNGWAVALPSTGGATGTIGCALFALGRWF